MVPAEPHRTWKLRSGPQFRKRNWKLTEARRCDPGQAAPRVDIFVAARPALMEG